MRVRALATGHGYCRPALRLPARRASNCASWNSHVPGLRAN
jgi:hypothetical protein